MKMPEEQFGGFTQEEKSSHLGVILGVLIVVLMLILGGLYLWSTSLQEEQPVIAPDTERPTAEENNEPESNNAEADAQALETTSTSDEIDAIEADIQSSNIDTVDSDMTAIDALIQ
jgi:flagellar basal body-associated protein FliL